MSNVGAIHFPSNNSNSNTTTTNNTSNPNTHPTAPSSSSSSSSTSTSTISSSIPTAIHHPRQPGPNSDSYFSSSNSTSHPHYSHNSTNSSQLARAPSSNSLTNKHQRTISNMSNPRSSLENQNNSNSEDSILSAAATANSTTTANPTQRLNHPGSINIGNNNNHDDHPHPDFDGPNDRHHPLFHQNHHAGNQNQQQQNQQHHFAPGPPSPSSLTDTILGLHSTLYGGKRSPEEVEEMVARYYESDAIFVNPLLSAHGRAQIANQFCMAFALPGMDVTSELRDVICSDFEFDGTRAGIIDQTITVTFLPTLFGSSSSSSQPSGGGGGYAAEFGAGHGGHGYDASEYGGPHFADGTSTPGYALQSGIALHGLGPTTPHPFANYSANNSAYPFTHSNTQTPAASGFQRHGGGGAAAWQASGRMSQGQSPVTPFSVSTMWNNAPGGSSRPHTPGWSSGIKPLSSTSGLPPNAITNNTSQMISAEEPVSGAAASASEVWTRPSMPQEALQPHWSAGGLGRRTIHGLLWSIFHPRQVLKEICSIKLHLMSRLEFNDAGLIVRHEDMWGLREAIEGIVPFASTVYALERRVAGLLVHWTIGKGFKLSAALLRKALPDPNATAAEKSAYAIAQHEHEQTLRGAAHNGQYAAIEGGNQVHEQYHFRQQERAGEAARALLNHRPPIPNVPGWHEGYHTISRSRAPSPTRYRWSASSSNAGTSTGRRSRTHSIGCPPYSRTVSSDNLQGYGQANSASMSNLSLSNNLAGSQISGADSLPPDAGAKYRRKINSNNADKDQSSRSSAELEAGLHLNFGGGNEERGRTMGPAQDRD